MTQDLAYLETMHFPEEAMPRWMALEALLQQVRNLIPVPLPYV